MQPWAEYQGEVAAFFAGLGLPAAIDEQIEGVRTSHDVDVVVRVRQAGIDGLWIVECKLWRSRVSKLHVLALREIVNDIGADRGILMSESGFQSGALEAASYTNVLLSSLANLRNTAAPEIHLAQIMEYRDRVDEFHERYWTMDKDHRIEYGLRPDFAGGDYSAPSVIDALRDALESGLRGIYPVRYNELAALAYPSLMFTAQSAAELVTEVRPVVDELDRRLAAAERAWAQHRHPTP